MGMVKDAWENLAEKDESKKGGALIHLLTVDIGDNWLVRLKDKEYLPIVIRGCLNDDQPYKWWERFMSACEIVNVKKRLPPPPTSQNSAYLCASILSYPDQYSGLLPPHPNIDNRAVERASLSDADIGAMKEAYNVLTTANSSVLEVLRSNDEVC